MPKPDFIYLASASPRRAQLLDVLAVPHRPLLPDPEEDAESLEAERAGEGPADYVSRVTRAKLQAARRRLRERGLPEAPILVADTTVALGQRILAKPADAEHAAAMLRALSGRTHHVFTAVAVGRPRRTELALSDSRVSVAPLSEADIAAYIRSGEPFGKAGSYAIQGRFAAWVRDIQGSYTGIMGLPLFEAAALLRRARVQFT